MDPVGRALVHVALGEMEGAFASLERAFELRSMRILLLTLDPRFEPLHDEPRYADLVQRIGLDSHAGFSGRVSGLVWVAVRSTATEGRELAPFWKN